MISGALAGYLVTDAHRLAVARAARRARHRRGLRRGASPLLVVGAAAPTRSSPGWRSRSSPPSATTLHLPAVVHGIGQNPPRIDRIGDAAADRPHARRAGWRRRRAARHASPGSSISAVGESPVAADALGYRRRAAPATWRRSPARRSPASAAPCSCADRSGCSSRTSPPGAAGSRSRSSCSPAGGPCRASLGALLFGLCDAVQLRLQGTDTEHPLRGVPRPAVRGHAGRAGPARPQQPHAVGARHPVRPRGRCRSRRSMDEASRPH